MGGDKLPLQRSSPSRLDIGDPDIPPPVRIAGSAPIVVTATMGAADQRHFDALRVAHFPPERNFLAAHITLFHQLPPSARSELERVLKAFSAETPPPAATVAGVSSTGTGVAYRVDSPELLDIRGRVADHFHGLLGAQDRGTPRLHITVQNKVASATARALLATLSDGFRPRALAITGLAAFHYRGGPWEPVFATKFRGRRT